MEAGRIGIFAKLDEDGAVSVSYKENNDLTVSLTSDKKLGYSAFCELVAAEVFNYGTPSELLDTKSGEEFVSLSGEETEIADGIYRMKYSVQNGENIKEGYVYIEYACVA